MLQRIMLSAIALLSACVLSAQTIEGTVTDAGKPLANATVNLLKPTDSSLQKIAVTDASGKFSFTYVKDKAMIRVSMIGYAVFTSQVLTVTDNRLTLPPIILERQDKKLNEVTVTASKPLIQYKGDKLIVNLDAAPSNAGATLLDALAKMPGVTVNADGSITLKGKSGVLIMIDGKETFLSSSELTSLLRSMPASASDQVEIISNPSSRYDAATTGGIINIKSKKSLQQGLNGTFTTAATISRYRDIDTKVKSLFSSRNSANWNYRQKKINLFGTLGYSRNNYFDNFNEERYFFIGNQLTSTVNNSNFYKSPSSFYQVRTGIDINLSQKSVLGFVVNTTLSQNTSQNEGHAIIKDKNSNPVYLINGNTRNPGSHAFNGNFNANYKYTPGKKDIEFLADASYILYRNVAQNTIENHFTDAASNPAGTPLILQQNTKYDFDIFVAKADYSQTINKSWRLESGIKTTSTTSISDQQFLRKTGSIFTNDPTRTNIFRYKENINAVYTSIGWKKDKLNIQAGFRVEQTIGEGYQMVNDSSFKRSRIDIFPSLFINYIVSDKYTIGLNYSRKLSRPAFRSLNPFVFITDSLYSYQGNPFLSPQFSHNIELNQTIDNKINITIGYYFVSGVITNLVKNDPITLKTQTYIENFNTYRAFVINPSVPIKVSTWWKMNLDAGLVMNRYSGISETYPVDLRSTYLYSSLTNTFTLFPLITADINFFYTSRNLAALIYFTPAPSYSLGLRKRFKNDNGNIAFSMNDPFFIGKRKGDAAFGNTFFNQTAAFANQTYSLSFTHRFGKNTIEAQRQKKNATAEEQGRL